MPTAYKQPMPAAAPAPFTRQQIKLLDERKRLQEQAAIGDQPGYMRLMYQRKLKALDQQIIGAGQPKPAPTVAPVAAPVAAPIAAPAPVAVPAPVAAPAPVAEPVIAASPAETAVQIAKVGGVDAAGVMQEGELQRQIKIDEARAAEMKRQEEIKRRRGTGIMSFITGGLRGLPSPLSQILGV